MQDRALPSIFSRSRKLAGAIRSRSLRESAGETGYLFEHMSDELVERLSFVRHNPATALLLGHPAPHLIEYLRAQRAAVTSGSGIDEEAPYSVGPFDLIASVGSLDTVNDLPGALIHMHRALAPGGMAIATLVGAPSLLNLRRAMLAADGERPAARMHPLVDVRAAAELIQRAGWHSPVVDSHTLRVSYPSLDRLVVDLRLHGMASRLASTAPPVTRQGLERAQQAFLEAADSDGKVIETFEILTLSGWRR
ncbi:class I SAM-dependent methyltransferase [Parerythrobacter lacustris]|uniref:Class I SAM-dependent methyltransferase n=1 Tax=Parerythrobacter lacustris TaxID=2969984 RepID=A0ABT1XRP8_9SPHN|nr:class I SAM-dependent methyltransferase [Parerythrobacter lacustris]MCR2833902.1 class I SAM-dependent methyltransferase [Parerythrobacter lacustris]